MPVAGTGQVTIPRTEIFGDLADLARGPWRHPAGAYLHHWCRNDSGIHLVLMLMQIAQRQIATHGMGEQRDGCVLTIALFRLDDLGDELREVGHIILIALRIRALWQIRVIAL